MCKILSDAYTTQQQKKLQQQAAAKIAIQAILKEKNREKWKIFKPNTSINEQNLMCTHYQIPCKVDNVRCDAREGERKRHGEKEKWLLSNVLSPCDSSIKSYKA